MVCGGGGGGWGDSTDTCLDVCTCVYVRSNICVCERERETFPLSKVATVMLAKLTVHFRFGQFLTVTCVQLSLNGRVWSSNVKAE